MTRRNFVHVSTVLAGTILVGAPIGRSASAPALGQTSAPPTVDRLAVRVVVDAYHDALVRTATVGPVEVQRTATLYGADLGKKHRHNEHGLSLHLESQRGGETRHALLDFGFTPTALFNNLDVLQIDTASVDTLIVSHGHFDHFGGLVPLLRRDRAKMRGDLPLYVGGENTFCYRYIIPMHCSGAGFIRVVQRDLPDRFIMSYTGTRYIFGA